VLFDKSFMACCLEDRLRHAYINERYFLDKRLCVLGDPYRADMGLVKSNVIHGYVLKGDQCSLSHLAQQIECCGRLFEQVTVVVAKHWSKALDQVPDWCGVLMVTQNDEGEVHWVRLRAPGASPNVDLRLAASVMWKGYLAERLGKIEGRMPPPSMGRMDLADRLLQLGGAEGVRQELMAFMQWRRTAPPLTLSWCEVH
jgi:hypothetical protein